MLSQYERYTRGRNGRFIAATFCCCTASLAFDGAPPDAPGPAEPCPPFFKTSRKPNLTELSALPEPALPALYPLRWPMRAWKLRLAGFVFLNCSRVTALVLIESCIVVLMVKNGAVIHESSIWLKAVKWAFRVAIFLIWSLSKSWNFYCSSIPY